jgi:hypothetical protein
MAKNRSTTIPDDLDEYLHLLCEQLGLTKSGLRAHLIDIGLNVYVRARLDRCKLAAQLRGDSLDQDKQIEVAARKKKQR